MSSYWLRPSFFKLSNPLPSVVEPEPDFLAGAGAGEKARLRAVAVWQGYCGGKVAKILVKFSHISTIYTQIERKNRYT